MNILFLIVLITLQPSIEVMQRDRQRTILRIIPSEDINHSIGGLIAYSHQIPTIIVIDAESGTQGGEEDVIELGSPCRMRDYNVLPFSVKGKKGDCVELEIEAFFEKGKPSYAFEPLYRSFIVNYDPSETTVPGLYLMVTPSEFVSQIEPLADWKRKKGWDVKIATLLETGSDQNSIKNYISDLYDTTNLEYVLLIGDIQYVPTFTYPNCAVTDHPYAMMDEDDFLPDILVGRLSASSTGELATIVAKILMYDMTPYMDDTLWYNRALMVGGNYPDYVNTAVPTKRCVRNRLLTKGFLEVDTVFYDPPHANGDAAMITTSINSGVLFLNYRGGVASWSGWDYPAFRVADVYGLDNGWMLPLVTSLVCYTGAYDSPECFGEAWLRAGTPYVPKGGIAFIGPVSAYTSTRWNNCLDYGIYWAITEEHIPTIGQILLRGKMELLYNFPLEQFGSSGVERYFHDYNLLGDPEMVIWGDVPVELHVEHPAELSIGSNQLTIEVKNETHNPITGALVSMYKEGEVSESEFTNAGGICILDVCPQTSGFLYLTVTQPGKIPYLDSINVNSSDMYVAYYSHIIKGDGIINSGETTSVNISFKNYGSQTASDVSIIFNSEDTRVTLIDSITEFDSFGAGEVKEDSFSFVVSSSCRDMYILEFYIKASDDKDVWLSGFEDFVSSSDFSLDTLIIGGDGIIDPGEEEDIYVTIRNNGSSVAYNVDGLLRNLTSTASVIDSIITFSELMTDSIYTAVFPVIIFPDVSIGKCISFNLFLTQDNGFMDTVFFCITAGEPDTTTPLGPDEYGYYAYDDKDAGFGSTPTYEWVEIDPEFGGSGTCLYLGDDEVKTVNLPFGFRFYGKEYTKISVCANGFLSMGEDICNDMYNWHIPSTMGPSSLIAPFWDDFDPTSSDSSGDVFYLYEEDNNRFIVEWSRVQHIHNYLHETPSELQTFEVLILDPDYHLTPTDDGEIVFQYHTTQNDDSIHNFATVGIGDHNLKCGIEYTFANSYPSEASPVINGRAIKFTTQPPDTFLGVNEEFDIKLELIISPNPSFGYISIKLIGGDIDLTDSKLGVYDLMGRCICKLKTESLNKQFLWDIRDESGLRLPKGVYFIKLTGSNFDITRKFLVLK